MSNVPGKVANDADGSLKARLSHLYEGQGRRPQAFRYAILGFDVVTILYVVGTSFVAHTPLIEGVDAVIGMVILADFATRLWISRRPMRLFLHPATWADVAAIVSFVGPFAGEGLGFLRVLRTLRLLHTYQMAARLRADFAFFRRHGEVIMATLNLLVFVFVMTGLVYETQYRSNPQIANYADALYFTVTSLTTTGFGDITLPGTSGRLISIAIMIFGVTLFLRLAQVLFRPPKVNYECPTCGLLRHDYDAVHCKHCGTTLHIRTEGGV